MDHFQFIIPALISLALLVCSCIRVRVKLDSSAFLYSRPIAHLPCPAKATLAVRCCPVYFELRTKKGEGKDTALLLIITHVYISFIQQTLITQDIKG